MKFIECEGMILTAYRNSSLEEIQKRVDEIRASGKPFVPWAYERFANHMHADMSAPDREHVAQELEMVAEFESVLRATYPEQSFVISHTPCYAVTYYQAIEGALTETMPLGKREKTTVFCNTCSSSQSYRLLPTPDPIFPDAEWGVCEGCGNDVIIHGDQREIRRLIVREGVLDSSEPVL
jgi:hypothetical protein